MKWEYKVIEDQHATEMTNKEVIALSGPHSQALPLDRRLTIDKLNQLGNNDWELVSYCPYTRDGGSVAIFKRPKNRG